MVNTIHIPVKWVVFFSQSGTEIVELCKRLNRTPDLIVTNSRPEGKRTINPELLKLTANIVYTENKPSLEEYYKILKGTCRDPIDTLITLHGWLRIIPQEILEEYPFMFNGHPGLITKYPELKGKDPQLKAWNLNLNTSGVVLQRVTGDVDSGSIIMEKEISIRNLSLDQLYNSLHTTSVQLWTEFIKRNWFPGK